MTYSKKDILTSISFMIFIISFAIVLTVFFKPLYYSDINRLGIDITSGLSVDTIKENYDILIQYQSIFYQGVLNLPDFVMSNGGRVHFEEVKLIFEIIQVIMIVFGTTSLILIYQQYQKKEFRFLKLTAIITIIIPVIIGALAAIDFNRAFILFHQIVFRNDYWIFDVRYDPVISILPEQFFMHCFMMIIVVVFICVGICFYLYHRIRKRYLEDISNI